MRGKNTGDIYEKNEKFFHIHKKRSFMLPSEVT